MKKILASLFLLLGLLISSQGYSLNNQDSAIYAGLLGGPNWLDINPHHNLKFNAKTGYLVGGMVGYRFDQPLRIEAEVSFRRNSFYLPNCFVEKTSFQGNAKTWAFMGNGYYDFNCDTVIRPYLGLGLGYARVRNELTAKSIELEHKYTHKFNENGFAYQLMAGVNYLICENVDIGAEYRYFSIANKKRDDSSLAFTVKRYF